MGNISDVFASRYLILAQEAEDNGLPGGNALDAPRQYLHLVKEIVEGKQRDDPRWFNGARNEV